MNEFRIIRLRSYLTDIRNGGGVRRFHTERGVIQQTVAEHSWGVAVLVDVLSDLRPSVQLLRAALCHDIPEHKMGDIPAPVKWDHPELRVICNRIEQHFWDKHGCPFELSADEDQVLKWADGLELLMTCNEYVHMGNLYAKSVARNITRHMKTYPFHEIGSALLDEMGVG